MTTIGHATVRQGHSTSFGECDLPEEAVTHKDRRTDCNKRMQVIRRISSEMYAVCSDGGPVRETHELLGLGGTVVAGRGGETTETGRRVRPPPLLGTDGPTIEVGDGRLRGNEGGAFALSTESRDGKGW